MKRSSVCYNLYHVSYTFIADFPAAPPRPSNHGREALLMKADHRKVSPALSLALNSSTSGLGNSLRPPGLQPTQPRLAEKLLQPIALPQKEEESDNWDDDFEGGIQIGKLARTAFILSSSPFPFAHSLVSPPRKASRGGEKRA